MNDASPSAAPARTSSIAHIDALDGARGAAVAAVVVFHAGHLTGGYLGVDLFFTLSGFLITSLLLAESTRTGAVGLGAFWARRARRLLPALAVLMVGIALYCELFATPIELGQIRGDAFATIAYVANWRQIFSHQNYFALFAAPSPLNHTWSLAIEEQFYVVWPLLFVGLLARYRRATPKAVLVTALALAGASTALMVVLYDPNNSARVYFGTDTRATAILLGAALAAWLAIHGPTRDRKRRAALEILGGAGLVVLAVAWTRLDGQSATLYRGGFLVCGLAATALLAAAVHPEPGPLARLLSFKPLCALGLISYGVYLYHWPIDIVLDQKRVGLAGWPLVGVQTVATLAVAIASFSLIEQPIRPGAIWAHRWRAFVPVITVGLVAALFVSTLGAQSPATVYVPSDPLNAAALAYAAAPARAQRVMIVGNSVGTFLGAGMKKIHPHTPIAVLDAAVIGCVFPPQIVGTRLKTVAGVTTNVAATPCDPSWEVGAIARFHPNVVFWIADDIRVGGSYEGHRVEPCREPFDSLFARSLRSEIARLSAGGAHVVVTTAAYASFLTVDVRHSATDCENRIVREVAGATGAQVGDLFNYVCPKGVCRVEQDGVVLRPDGLHYDGAGARIVAQWLIDQVERDQR